VDRGVGSITCKLSTSEREKERVGFSLVFKSKKVEQQRPIMAEGVEWCSHSHVNVDRVHHSFKFVELPRGNSTKHLPSAVCVDSVQCLGRRRLHLLLAIKHHNDVVFSTRFSVRTIA
jgi:hypothetical protein